MHLETTDPWRRKPAMRPKGTALVLALVVVACDRLPPGNTAVTVDSVATYSADSMGVLPPNPEIVRMVVRGLREASAAVVSRVQPELVFTVNDSESNASLFAVSRGGARQLSWVLSNAQNVDWESAAPGPCGSVSAGQSSACIYIGDTGDNAERRPNRRLYRLPEPAVDATMSGRQSPLVAESLTYVYEDGPHDVEAMFVAPDSSIHLITKRVRLDANRQPRPALVFRLLNTGWDGPTTAVAKLIDSLPIIPGSAPLRTITDGALSPDGAYLVVRTYTQAFLFATNRTTGRVDRSILPTVCNLAFLEEPGGEGITWLADGRLLLMSEGEPTQMSTIRCPLPGVTTAPSGR